MKGDKVIVQAFGGEPLIRRVWEVSPEAVFICSEENYHTLARGEEGLWPVGFLKEFVFCYNSEIDLENWRSAPALWGQLIPYD